MDFETGAFVDFAGDGDRAAMGLNNGFGNRETKAAPAISSGFVSPIESFEKVGQFIRRYPFAGIGNTNCDCPILRASVHLHLAFVAIVMNGVGQKVGDDLADPFRVAGIFQIGRGRS